MNVHHLNCVNLSFLHLKLCRMHLTQLEMCLQFSGYLTFSVRDQRKPGSEDTVVIKFCAH